MWIVLMSMFIVESNYAADLRVRIEHLRSRQGSLLYLLFDDAKGFPDDPSRSVRQGSLALRETALGPPEILFTSLPPKTYAFTVIHDENDNGKLDTNFLGLPLEGFGFSQNPTIFIGPPGFKRCKFEFGDDDTKDVIMRYL